MTRNLIVWDGFGGFMGLINFSEKEQVKLAIEELCEEWFEHCRGELKSFTQEDYDKLITQTSVGSNIGLNVTHILPLKSGDEIEVALVQVRDYSHYEVRNDDA